MIEDYLNTIEHFYRNNLYPEIRITVDSEFGSSYPVVLFYYVIHDPWNFYDIGKIYQSPVFYNSTEARKTMIAHCNNIINLYEHGKHNN